MTRTLPAIDLPAPLAAVLRRAAGPGGTCVLDPSVPRPLWERALLSPAEEFLRRPGKEVRARLTVAGWHLGGGGTACPSELGEVIGDAGACPSALGEVIEVLHAGSLIVDDVEDDSDLRRGAPALHRLVGAPLAINTGNWMYFWALSHLDQRIDEMALPAETQLAIHRAAVSTLERCHQGQALDLGVVVGDLEQGQVAAVVAATTRLKTGALMGLAAYLGAAAAGASRERAAAIAAFGEAAGVGLQMLDDLGGVACRSRLDKGVEDLRGGRPTWPWAWLAETGDELTFARLQQRARAVADGDPADDAAGLAEALCEAIEDTGRDRIRQHLDRALAALADAVGDGPAVRAIGDQLRHLEESYG